MGNITYKLEEQLQTAVAPNYAVISWIVIQLNLSMVSMRNLWCGQDLQLNIFMTWRGIVELIH